MTSCTKLVLVLMLAVLGIVVQGKVLAQAGDKDRLLTEPDVSNGQPTLDLVDDDGGIETALINYLFAKQMVNRLRNQMDISDLQRKRSYWRQCAFNAVSCFGK